MADQAWKEVEPIKDQMAKFLAERTMHRMKNKYGIKNVDMEAQEKAIRESLTYNEMQDKIVKILQEK